MLQSVATALRAIEYLAQNGRSGIAELGRALDVSTGTAFRIARTLVETGYAEQDPESRTYKLSMRLPLLVSQTRTSDSVRAIAAPYLQQLFERVGETVNLGVLDGGEVVYLDVIRSRESITVGMPPGSRVVAHNTALGKVILANLSTAERESYLAAARFDRFTESTVGDAEALRSQLGTIAAVGYALDENELLEDVRCVAAPILSGNGRPIAAISMTALQSRFVPRQAELIRLVTRAGADLSDLIRVDAAHVG